MGTVLLLAIAAAQEPPAPQGPAAYWKFDETTAGTAANQVTGAPSGAPQGGPTVSTLVPALSYNANPLATPRSLLFDGTNDTVNVANFGSFSQTTVSVWIYRTGSNGGRESIVSYKEGSGVNMGFVLSLNETGGTHYPRLWVQVNGGWVFAEQAVSIPLNTAWTHLAGTYDGANIRLYRDGAQVAITAAAGSMTNTGSQNTGIGSRASLDSNWFPGHVDDVRIYARALSAPEIAVLAAGVPAPTQLAPTAGVNQVSLSWTAPAGAVTYTYNVKRAPSGTGAFVTVGSASGTSFTDSTASGGVSYDYAITAVSAAESGVSNLFTVVPLLPPPRTDDHSEGFLDDNCACGATSAAPAWPLAILALLSLAAARKR